MSTTELVFGYLGALLIVFIFIWLGIMLHMAYTKMDEILEHLKDSPTVMTFASLRRTGPWGKLMLIGSISGFVTFPRGHLKRGIISARDLDNFPAPLKRKLVILHWVGLVLVSLLFLLWGIGKIIGWIK